MKIINVPDICPADDPFTHLIDADWVRLSGLPANHLERATRRVRISRYRAAVQAACSAKGDAAVVTHLPLMTAATATALRLTGRAAPHLAFSFNFTRLPTGRRLQYIRRAISDVDQFATFSLYERDLYSTYFDLPSEKFKPVIWTQEAPPVAQSGAGFPRPYVCAVGGEGRDFRLILEAARKSRLRFVVIARPASFTGLSVPDNVTILSNIPLGQVWRIACNSLGVLIPLESADTCCGHITIVGAKMLGLPIVTTLSPATTEYLEGRKSILVSEAGDLDGFRHSIDQLADENERLKEVARTAAPDEIALHSRKKWEEYLRSFLEEFGRRHPIGARPALATAA